MPVEKIKHITIADQHVDHVVLRDHFGSLHLITIHPFVVTGDSHAGYAFTPVDIEAAIEQEKQLMEARERHYLQHLMKHHPQHPRLLSHPEYAGAPRKEGELSESAAACKECA